jgi:hypothetical protein
VARSIPWLSTGCWRSRAAFAQNSIKPSTLLGDWQRRLPGETVDFKTFEDWLEKLSPEDLKYLRKHPVWKKEYLKVQKNQALQPGFVEKTMEILEGGSESET